VISKSKIPVYIVKCEDKLLFVSPDANEAIIKSIELSVDQHAHAVEIWIGDKRVGTIETNGEIQNIFR
jgi:Leu/Phe-tRNA-protein transferase